MQRFRATRCGPESDQQFDNSFLSMSIVCVVEAGNGWLGAAVAQEVLSRTLLDGKPIAATIVFHAYSPAEVAQLAGLTKGAILVEGTVTADALEGALAAVKPEDPDEPEPDCAALFLCQPVDTTDDFDAAFNTVIDCAREALEAARAAPLPTKVVRVSSIAAFGADESSASDASPSRPSTPIGSAQLCVENTVDAYSCAKLIDGRSVRLPTVLAPRGFYDAGSAPDGFSAVLGETFAQVPVKLAAAAGAGGALASAGKAVQFLVGALEVDEEALPAYSRTLTMPAVHATIGQLYSATRSTEDTPT